VASVHAQGKFRKTYELFAQQEHISRDCVQPLQLSYKQQDKKPARLNTWRVLEETA
jgi:hypothetical protein